MTIPASLADPARHVGGLDLLSTPTHAVPVHYHPVTELRLDPPRVRELRLGEGTGGADIHPAILEVERRQHHRTALTIGGQ
jgi:hypothetical protein